MNSKQKVIATRGDYLLVAVNDNDGQVIKDDGSFEGPVHLIDSILARGYWDMLDEPGQLSAYVKSLNDNPTIIFKKKGSAKSGNYGHRGRPGLVGGSGKGELGGLAGEGYEFTSGTENKPKDARYRRITALLNKTVMKRLKVYNLDTGEYDIVDKVAKDKISWKSVGYDYNMRGYIKDGIVRDLCKRMGLDPDDKDQYETVNALIKQWQQTANDTNMRSLAIQQAATKEFGIPLSAWQQEKIDYIAEHYSIGLASKPLPGCDETHTRNFLRAMYDNTQTQLRDAGIGPDDVVMLFRGTSMSALRDEAGAGLIPDSSGYFYGTSSIGYKSVGQSYDYSGSAMESWSAGSSGAKQFAHALDAVTLRMYVPARDIIGTSRTGFGCINEGEVVIAGSAEGHRVTVYSYKTDIMAHKSLNDNLTIKVRVKGGAGSGNFGHAGRPGLVGGSGKGGGLLVDHQFSFWSDLIIFGVGESDISGADIEMPINNLLYKPIEAAGIGWRSVELDPGVVVSSGAAGEIKDNIVRKLCVDMGLDPEDASQYDKVNQMIKQWSYTANDGDYSALCLQESAAKVLGIELSDWQQQNLDRIREHNQSTVAGTSFLQVIDDRAEIRESFIKAMYENTQAQLREVGIGPDDYIELYRGTTIDALRTADGKDVFEAAGVETPTSKYGDDWSKAQVGSASDSVGRDYEYHGNAIESWSASRDTALEFMEGDYDDVVLMMYVPAKNIVSTARTGLGCLNEAEVVIVGNTPGIQHAYVTDWGGEYEEHSNYEHEYNPLDTSDYDEHDPEESDEYPHDPSMLY